MQRYLHISAYGKQYGHALLGLVLLVMGGCASYQYEAKPLETTQVADGFMERNLEDPGLQDYLRGHQYPLEQWPLADWDLGALTLAAYYFHPGLQVAVREYDKAAVHAETVNQLINPGVGVPLEYHSDTSGNPSDSPWAIGLLFEFVLERPAKRRARHEQAQAELDAARININATAWNIYTLLRRQYLNYHAVLKNEAQLRKQKEVTEEILRLLKRRLELGQASEFEVNAMQLDLQRTRLALTSQRVAAIDAWHALAGSLGLPAVALNDIHIATTDTDRYARIHELDHAQLQTIALTQRLDIQQALADYAAQEAALRFEIEKQYPDITLSPGYFFDQGDNIWSLGTSLILPLFHPQNEGPIQEALAAREIKQAEFMALQARVINEVASAYDRLEAQQSALREAQQLLQEVHERNRQVQRQYDLGYADHLQLSRGLLEVVAVEQAVSELEFATMRSAGQLEDALQYPLLSEPAYRYLFNVDAEAE